MQGIWQSRRNADELIFGLYQAVESREQLSSFFEALGRQFDAHVVGLRGHDDGYASRKYFDCIGFPVQEWARLENQLVDGHPWHKKGFADMMREGVGHSGTIMPDHELHRTQFHEVVLKPMQIGYGMGICLWAKPPGEMAVLSINRLQRLGSFGDADMQFAKSLLPHFRSAYSILRRLSAVESQAQSLKSAFERLNIGLVLADGTGKCIYHNESADADFHGGRGVSLSIAGNLRCADPNAQNALLQALRQAARDSLQAPAHIHIRDRFGELNYVLVVTMLHADIIPAAQDRNVCATIFIHSRSSRRTTQPEAELQLAFGLTPAEARLASLLAMSLQLKECADILGVSLPTVRSQLRVLLAKTGTRRQAELLSALEFVLRIK